MQGNIRINDVQILNDQELNISQKVFVRQYFMEHLRPEIFPIILDKITHPPKLKDTTLYLAIRLKKNKKAVVHALIEIPSYHLSRFLQLPTDSNFQQVIFLDDVIRLSLDTIFQIYVYDAVEAYTIKYSKDTESDVDNDIAVTFPNAIESSMEKRKKNTTQFLIYDDALPKVFLNLLEKKLSLSRTVQYMGSKRVHNFNNFIIPPYLNTKEASLPIKEHIPHPDLVNCKSILQRMKKKDILLNFPFHSFDTILDLLREASIDPNVSHIRIVLFRVAQDSLVIRSLMTALQNGKDVTVFIELRARYDEEANIVWANKLRKAGAHVITRIAGLKVHSKLCLITRREKGEKIYYACIGTGNLHEKTSRIYNDIMLLTANQSITNEARQVFAFFDKKIPILKPKNLLIAPFNLRSTINQYIQNEIRNAKAKKPAQIFIKVSNLNDKDIQQRLLQAGKAGVKIKLIIRGICGLFNNTNVKMKNIEIVSVSNDRVEHGRVFIFENAGKPIYLIGSADLMTRNLDYRLEIVVPIRDKKIQKQLQQTMQIVWEENCEIPSLKTIQQDNMFAHLHDGLQRYWTLQANGIKA